MDYIFGFGGRRNLQEHIEYAWKINRNQLISNGVEDPRLWVICWQYDIN